MSNIREFRARKGLERQALKAQAQSEPVKPFSRRSMDEEDDEFESWTWSDAQGLTCLCAISFIAGMVVGYILS